MIYVDLDGVLANFDAWARKHIDTSDQSKYMQLFIKQYKSCFRDLEPIDSGLELLRGLDEPCILTAMPNHQDFICNGLEIGRASCRERV